MPDMCPFCRLHPDVEQQPIGNDDFGNPASIGGIRSCNDCARIAQATGTADILVSLLEQEQAAAD